MQNRAGIAFSWRSPRLILIGDGFTDPECADRILVAAEAASGSVSDQTPGRALWVHLRDRAAPAALFGECAARLVERLRNVSPSLPISVNGRPEVAEALQCGYHAGARDAEPGFSGEMHRPYGRSAHNYEEARLALGGDRQHRRKGNATGIHSPQYLFFSPVFNPQGKPGYSGAGVDALRDFARYVQGRVPVYALGGVTPERIAPCLAAGSYGVAVLSGIMQADRPGEAARAYLDALPAGFEEVV